MSPKKGYKKYRTNITSAAKGKARKNTVREATEALKKELKKVNMKSVMDKLQELQLDEGRKKKKKPMLRLNRRVVRKSLKVLLKKDKKDAAKKALKDEDGKKVKKGKGH